MADQEITNLMLFFAGNQRLPTNVKVIDEPIDQTDIMADLEIQILNLINNIENFATLLHNKSEAKRIYESIINIIDLHKFDIKQTFIILWEIAIFGDLPITGVPKGKTLEDFAKEHIEILRPKILNKKLQNFIKDEIRTKSKFKSIIKKILNLGVKSFDSMFNDTGLTNIQQKRKELIESADQKVSEQAEAFVKEEDFEKSDDQIVSNFYNIVKTLHNPILRNEYYNKILLKLVKKMTSLKKIPNKLKKILLQFYCFLIKHETIKIVDPKITEYISTNPIDWFTYQVSEMSTKLQPHWNFKSPEFILDPWQKSCLQHIDMKENILLSAPTSSGKTVLSTYAINKFRKILYVVPSEATAWQLSGMIMSSLMDKEKLVGSTIKNIRLELSSISKKRFDKADDIIVGTPEQMCRLINTKEFDQKLDYIILDEFHNISYEGGEYYEYLLKYGGFNKIPVMCLSATIPNFDDVHDWLSSILTGNIFSINEHKRFFNQKRLMVVPTTNGTKMVTIDPLKHMKHETIRAPNFTQIGLYPKEVLELYQKLPGLERIDESTPRFIKLDDVQRLEVDSFSYLKKQSDEVLSKFISDSPIDSQSLTLYQLYVTLRDIDCRMKPMIVFKMESMKCLEIYTSLIELINDYNELVYGNFNEDQCIVEEYFAEIEKIEKSANLVKDESKEDAKDKEDLRKQETFKPYLFRLEEFAKKYLRIKFENEIMPQAPQILPDVNTFNKKYGANLDVAYIYQLRTQHINNERMVWKYDSIRARNGYAIHDKSRLISNGLSVEQTKKIRYQINRELEREYNMNGEFPSMKQYGKEYSKFNTSNNVVSYSNPVMLGFEYGLLPYNMLLNPAFNRICQQQFTKFPFIWISDKSLAVGINYPLKSVMLLGGLKGEPLEEIDNTLAHQAMGRAGRRGLDMEGIVIYCGVNITNILTPQYRNVVPNNSSKIKNILTKENERLKKFILIGEREPELIKLELIEQIESKLLESDKINTHIQENWDDLEDWEKIADSLLI
jgi:hypothetical protein